TRADLDTRLAGMGQRLPAVARIRFTAAGRLASCTSGSRLAPRRSGRAWKTLAGLCGGGTFLHGLDRLDVRRLAYQPARGPGLCCCVCGVCLGGSRAGERIEPFSRARYWRPSLEIRGDRHGAATGPHHDAAVLVGIGVDAVA